MRNTQRFSLTGAVVSILCLVSVSVASDDAIELHRAVVRKALPLLEAASAGTAQQRTCFTCHGQAMPVFVCAEARLRGFEIDEDNWNAQIQHTLSFLERGKENYLKGKGQGGRVDMAGYALWTLEVGGIEPNETTAAVTGYILSQAKDAGYWRHASNRPPSEASDFTTTYLALRGLQVFGTKEQQAEIEESFSTAQKWLIKSEPNETEDAVFQLRALSYLGADEKIQSQQAKALLTAQRQDGGWAQKPDMESDAYATGQVLVALARSEQLATKSEAYQRGLAFLRQHQQADGSWKVISRSKPFQKYFETGFPHGKNQFISTTATAWATLAFLLALPEVDGTQVYQ